MKDFFRVKHFSKKSKARIGEINTSHGIIRTPAFMAAGTKGTIKALPTQFIKEIGIQVGFVNTYHLVTHPGVDVIKKAGGIHKFANLNIPLMSDSGGFQVFSLANSKLTPTRCMPTPSRCGIKHFQADVRGEEEPLLVKISDDGVKFRSTYDGRLVEFTPEKSIEYQQKIGADICMAFDECIYYGSSYDYAKKATERTHKWLKRCIAEDRRWKEGIDAGYDDGSKKLDKKNPSFTNQLPNPLPNLISKHQFLYGIIQGGVYEDLRKKSAEFVVSQPVNGVAIGGVSVGESKKEMRDQVRWVSDYLPKDKPVHLLGVGQFDDILDLVRYGIDTFDCVEPTRLARMGTIYQARYQNFLSPLEPPRSREVQSRKKFNTSPANEVDVTKLIYKNNLEPVDINCNCYVCANFTKSYLHHLFKQREILGYTLATYHNLWVMEKFFDKIRKSIEKDLI